MKLEIPMALSAALIATTSVTAQEAPQPAARQEAAPQARFIASSDEVIGLELATATDKDVGEIGDLLIDPKSGEIRYAIIEVGGFLGVGEDDRIVPWRLIQVRRDAQDAARFRAQTLLEDKQVESAPECKDDTVLGSDLDRRIEAVFGKDEEWAYVGDGQAAFVRLSRIEGAQVTGAQANEIGEVQDVVLAPDSACVAYVVLDTNEAAGNEDIALPFSRLRIAQADEGKLALSTELDARKLQGAPEYDEQDRQRMCSTAWVMELSKHYECDPFWKSSRFASARRANPGK
jgi:sporulation protein YlmC with PRC-barrel domain